MTRTGLAIAAILALIGYQVSEAAEMPTESRYVNSLGMKFVRIKPGTFSMGGLPRELPKERAGRRHMRDGDPDEQPVLPGVVEITLDLVVVPG